MSLLSHHSLSIPMKFIDCLMRMRCNLFEGCFTSTSDTFQKQSKWKILPYKKLAKVTDNFDQSHCLGKRGFATEYYGKWLSYGHLHEQCKYKRELRYNCSSHFGVVLKSNLEFSLVIQIMKICTKVSSVHFPCFRKTCRWAWDYNPVLQRR